MRKWGTLDKIPREEGLMTAGVIRTEKQMERWDLGEMRETYYMNFVAIAVPHGK